MMHDSEVRERPVCPVCKHTLWEGDDLLTPAELDLEKLRARIQAQAAKVKGDGRGAKGRKPKLTPIERAYVEGDE